MADVSFVSKMLLIFVHSKNLEIMKLIETGTCHLQGQKRELWGYWIKY